MENSKKWFNYVVFAVVLLIPFIYSFFYLKAYWDPYGKGNIDNLPVAIVNEDTGTKGDLLVDSLKEKDTLKLDVVSSEVAYEGLNDKTYYAVISIPKDFSSSMESVGTSEKKHPTITYSPNQKSNYLSSQIVDKILLNVELSLDNEINSEVDGKLTEKLQSVPENLETISDGLSTMESGISTLQTGTKDLNDGLNSLNTNYVKFNKSLATIVNGSNKVTKAFTSLNEGTTKLANKTKGLSDASGNLQTLVSSVGNLNTSYTAFSTGVDGVSDFGEAAAQVIVAMYEQTGDTQNALYIQAKAMLANNSFATVKATNEKIASGVSTLNNEVSALSSVGNDLSELSTAIQSVSSGVSELYNGVSTLDSGIGELYKASSKIYTGIDSLADGSAKVYNGVKTLNNGVSSSKEELDTKIKDTKEELNTLNDLEEYTKNPMKVKTDAVNEVASYGTAFSPFFMSIALWVGALMMFMVFYYDKENRFGKLSIENKNRLQRTLYYHGVATLSGIILGILLNLLLDFNVTNHFLYYFALILVANTFMAIMNFLIVNLKDIGKFIALIILVLQLCAAGGTFPIETVSHGFRFLHSILPMTYSINIFKECLISIESNILIKNIIILGAIFISFTIFNIISDVLNQKKESDK